MEEKKLLADAIAFAAQKHKDQERRDGTPYIYHPLQAAEIVKSQGHGMKTQIAAVLHDVLEDTDALEEEVAYFGEDVLEAVKLVTRPEGMDEEDYVRAILENPMAAAVKNADKIHNMREIPFCGNREWAKYYVNKVKNYYYRRFTADLDEAIDRAEEMLDHWEDENRNDS